jgi:hypothetical protein
MPIIPRTHEDSSHFPKSPQWGDRFDFYFAPSGHIGATLPSGVSNASAGLAYSIGMIGAARMPHLLHSYLGEFVFVSYESRAVSMTDASGTSASYNVRYIGVTPGFSIRGIVSAGLTVGFPVALSVTTFTPDAGVPVSLRLSLANLLLEPRLLIGIPITATMEHGIVLTIAGGYPLRPLMNNTTLDIGSAHLAPGALRLPELQLGVSYVIPYVRQPAYFLD